MEPLYSIVAPYSSHNAAQEAAREVGGWGRDPKKCTGRGWGMGSRPKNPYSSHKKQQAPKKP